MGIGRRAMVGLASLGLFWSAAAVASPVFTSDSRTAPIGDITTSGSGTTSSSAFLNSSDNAQSSIHPGTLTMGAAASANDADSFSETTMNSDFYSCTKCGAITDEGVGVAVTITLSVKMTDVTSAANNGFLDFEASYNIDGDRFDFSAGADGPGTNSADATYRNAAGVTSSPTITTTLSGGDVTYSVSVTEDDAVCTAEACGSNPVTGDPLFADSESISAEVDSGSGATDFIDGLDPFSVTVVSLDPDFTFANELGNASTPVPEPVSLSLFAAALVGTRLLRRGP